MSTHIRIIPPATDSSSKPTLPFLLSFHNLFQSPILFLPSNLLPSHTILKLLLIFTKDQAGPTVFLTLGGTHLGFWDTIFGATRAVLKVLLQVDLSDRFARGSTFGRDTCSNQRRVAA